MIIDQPQPDPRRDLPHPLLASAWPGCIITLSADFLALVQILVYVGAIAVLMLFAILLTPRAARDNEESLMTGYPAMILMGLVIDFGGRLRRAGDRLGSRCARMQPSARSGARSSVRALINQYVLPFEIGAVMLTAALVGAIALARQDDEDAAVHPSLVAV